MRTLEHGWQDEKVLTVGGHFAAYGPSHWAVLALFALGCAGLILIGRRHRTPPAPGESFSAYAKGFSQAYALAMAFIAIGTKTYSYLPSRWNLGSTLPLGLSDLAWPVAIIALWTLGRHWFALTYYWGLTLSIQALVTPALNGPDYPGINFLDFFGMHLLVVWAAVYMTWGLSIRPNWHSYRFAALITATWGLATYCFNSLAETNYGYLNHKPRTGSALNLLGPWPWYVLAEVAIILSGWALITWPWTRRTQTPTPTP
jgi:hypothetical integral membrane protein (TIGR02206 family)